MVYVAWYAEQYLYNKLTVVFEPSSISFSIESVIIITDKLCIYTYRRPILS